jgi:para-nitrobenzyl esterase
MTWGIAVKIESVGRASLFMGFVAVAVAACLSLPPDTLSVKTADGKVRGKLINDGKVRAFQGIPYAAPPVGNQRWKAPQPVVSWNSELDATKYGHRCAQNHVFEDMVFQDSETTESGSEDCLTLNVYAPSRRHDNTKLPVMFWIHGGGYTGGSGSEPRHNGDFLPLKGVVLVTINYRLGVFGFLALPELASEQGGSSGNYGLMDMVAALSWVKRNIAAFGGDPDCVTIFGESAGSFAVSTLMAAPSAQGLFHRATGESGGALNSGTLSMESLAIAGPKDAAWAKEAGANSLADLRAMPTEQILAAAGTHNGVRFRPVVDGKFLSESVLDSYSSGRQAKIPLLAGFNRDEGSGAGMTAEKWQAAAKQRFPDKADAFLRLYPGPTDAAAIRSAADFSGDQFIAYSTWKWMQVDRKTGDKNIYRYKLDLAAPPSRFHSGSYAFHSDDIEYVFGTLDTRPGAMWRAEDYALSEQMMSYWTNFARRGDPNGVDGNGQRLPEWPKYGDGDPVLHLDNPITSRPDENRSRYEFWLNSDN